VDVCLVIKRRLEELGLEQKKEPSEGRRSHRLLYFTAADSQEAAPPRLTEQTSIRKWRSFLKLPSDRLSKLAELQRREELKRDLAGPPAPMFAEIRELILRKCVPDKQVQVREIFEKQPFGELERLITQKLLDVIKKVAKEELNSENWLHLVARLAARSYEETRVTLLEFLDTDVFSLSPEKLCLLLGSTD